MFRIVTNLAIAAVVGGALVADAAAQTPVRVVVRTELGDIVLEVDAKRAPSTAANFLRYVDAGHYDGGTFHRTVKMDNQPDSPVKIEVIQAGVSAERTRDGFPAIPLERTSVTGRRHTDGTISMARGQPDSATSGWFICINDQPSLDFGRKIQQAPNTDAQRLTPPITILKAARIQ
jgi:peptidyl-prolyl cis-trans isomerase A (cyclophilin A)